MASRASRLSIFSVRSPISQVAGLLLCATAFFLLISLVTYNRADPSLNRATASVISNAGGYGGALAADLLLQVMGLASILLVLVPMSWGWKLMVSRPATHLWLRVTALVAAMVGLALLMAVIPPFSAWPVKSGFGGSLGKLLLEHTPRVMRNPLFFLFLMAGTLAGMAVAFGMSVEEWRGLVHFARRTSMWIHGVILSLWLRIRPEPRDEDEEEEYYENDEYADPWYRRTASTLKERLLFWRRGDEEYDEEEEEEIEEEEEEEEEEPRPRKRAAAKKPSRPAMTTQSSLALPKGDYMLPAITLLSPPAKTRKSGMNDTALQQNAKLLETVLQDFGVQGRIMAIRPGPVVTLYELEPSAGTKSSRVVGLSDDIARYMSALSARIAVIPGRNAIGIELPNATRETVYLREMIEGDVYGNAEAKLPLALGKDISGGSIVVDLAKMPHLLVAGTTGSGKSVAINTMILSLVYRLSPEECKFIMIDPKMLELSVYDGIPHLLSPVVTEPGKAVVALKWTVKEMENRYRLMANLGVRNIDGYNKAIREAKAKGKQLTRRVQTGFNPDTGTPLIEEVPLDMAELPYIVVIVDEMADLMIVAGKDIESSIQRLAQMARAAGIHIIMATQRPSVDVITGVIKANFPTRISFQVTSRIDSRTILGEQGAEQLLGQGDMLYMAGGGRITRVHGPFVADKEVETVVAHLKAQGEPVYIEDITRDDEEGGGFDGEEGEKDEMYDQAVAIVSRDRKASTSYVQRCLKIGYNRAATIIERMEREGIVGPANHVGKREVLVREDS